MADIFYTASPELHRVARIEGKDVVELDFEILGKAPSLIGGIFMGRVIETQKPLGVAFVDIGQSMPGMIPLKEGTLPPITQGDSLLVQVNRDENVMEDKGVRLTRLITLALGPLLYTPFTPGLSLSKRLKERAAMKDRFKLAPHEGLVVRHWVNLNDPFEKHLSQLRDEWEDIQNKAIGKPPYCVSAPPSLFMRILRSLGSQDKLFVDDLGLSKKGGIYLREKAFDENCEDAWESLFSQEIPLSQGGNLYIEETRGLTVIDINSQGAMRHSFSFNRTAIKEVMRQIRLRDLGGKILIDLAGSLKDVKPLLQGIVIPSDMEIFGISPMGLLEMTRRRKRLSLPQRLKLQLN